MMRYEALRCGNSPKLPRSTAPLRSRKCCVARASLYQPPNAWQNACIVAAASVLSLTLYAPASQATIDPLKVGTCVLAKCQTALAGCIADVGCFEDLVCLQSCTGAPDEIGCQIKCGDQYEDRAVATFNACAISEQKCVPTKADEGLFPKPNDCALDTTFDLNNFQGRWFITAGFNTLFDIFPCQEHFFKVPEPSKLTAEINWRVPKGGGDFIQRQSIQNFVQNPDSPSILSNRGNEYLHYEDDWYIIGYKPDTYVFVYYQGNNDAWKGYGGAVVYTKARSLPTELVPELEAAAAKVGMKWTDFTVTDNSCPGKPRRWNFFQEIDQDFKQLEKSFEESLESFGRGFTIIGDDA